MMPSEVANNARVLDEQVCMATVGVLGVGRLDFLEVDTVENSFLVAEIEMRGDTADRISIWSRGTERLRRVAHGICGRHIFCHVHALKR